MPIKSSKGSLYRLSIRKILIQQTLLKQSYIKSLLNKTPILTQILKIKSKRKKKETEK